MRWLLYLAFSIIFGLYLMNRLLGYANSPAHNSKTLSALPFSPVFKVFEGFLNNRLIYPLITEPLLKKIYKNYMKVVQEAADVSPPEFGPQDQVVPIMNTLVNEIMLCNTSCLSVTARLLFTSNFLTSLAQQKIGFANYARDNPHVFKEEIRAPIIIVGLPRTGTTFLHRLMCLDDGARYMRVMDMLYPDFPPPSRDTYMDQKKMDRLDVQDSQFEQIVPNYFKNFNIWHEYRYDLPEEDILLMMAMGFIQAYDFMASLSCGSHLKSEYAKISLDANNKSPAYQYVHSVLKICQSTYPAAQHWVLKAPYHSLALPELVKEFPTARLVFCHRRPDKLLPSTFKMSHAAVSHYIADKVGEHSVAVEYTRNLLETMANRIVDFRQDIKQDAKSVSINSFQSDKQILDIAFSDVCKDPIQVVRDIYQHFGLTVSKKFEKRMEDYVEEHKQHKHGKVKYSLEELNFDADKVKQVFQRYTDHFEEFLG